MATQHRRRPKLAEYLRGIRRRTAVSFSEGSALPSEQFRIMASNLLGASVASRAATVNLGAAPTISASVIHAAVFQAKALNSGLR